MLGALRRLFPFPTAGGRRLALLFGVVYFAQGMWYLADQPITIVLKERGLTASQVAFFFLVGRFSWNVKPLYGLLSDFVPLFGRHRQSYFWLSSALAAAAGLGLGLLRAHPHAWLLALFTTMGFGLAFTDVLTDALMVETGKPLGLTGAFQAVQWAAISVASILSGELGGHFAEGRNLQGAFLAAATFPFVSLLMAIFFVREPRRVPHEHNLAATWTAVRAATTDRTVWLVAGLILFFNFSPSFGPAMQFYQTDTLGFSQRFIGDLLALAAVGQVLGAMAFAPVSRRLPLRRMINVVIGIGAVGTLAYLFYRDAVSAIVIDSVFGFLSMIIQLAFLDLAAKACPRRVEATFFALLMSVYNMGTGLAQWTGGLLYDWAGYTPLVVISAGFTALTWLMVPLVDFDGIEARARRPDPDAIA